MRTTRSPRDRRWRADTPAIRTDNRDLANRRRACRPTGTAAFPTLVRAADEVLEQLQTASSDTVARFASHALALPQGDDPDLFTLVADRDGAYLAPPSGIPLGHWAAERVSPISCVLRCNDVPLLRLALGCTNGIGLSALCARTFDVAARSAANDPQPDAPPPPSLAELLSRAEGLAHSLTTGGAATGGRAELLSVLRAARKLERAR